MKYILLFLVLMLASCSNTPPQHQTSSTASKVKTKQPDAAQSVAPIESSVQETKTKQVRTTRRKWYEGGTLHDKSALEWQTASSADKLATCADFVTTMWQNGDLKRSIANRLSTVDDVRPYAQELVVFLDTAFKPDPDIQQNRKLFANQAVSSTSAMGMILMGWTK